MKKINRVLIFSTFTMIFFPQFVFSQTESSLENRIESLENEVEQLSQEISTLNKILSELGLGPNTSNESNNGADRIPVINNDSPIQIDLLELTYHESNSANDYANDFSDWLSFSFNFTNQLEKETRAVKGSVIFKDLFGDEWWRIGLALNDPIKPGATITWIGQIDYNGFISAHKTAKNSNPKNVIVEYLINKIIFQDGSQIEFE